MPLSIQGNSLFSFNRTLNHEDVQRAINASSKDEATHVGIWEKIKDWFCGTNTSEALEKIYVLTHDNDEPDTESILKKVTAFYQLKEMAYPVYQDRFQASITPNEDGIYTFSFSIKDVMDKIELRYGNTGRDIYSIEKTDAIDKNHFSLNKYYERIQFSIENIINNKEKIEVTDDWMNDFLKSINEIKINTQENLAKEFNNEIKEFYDLNIYANPYELNNEPIYSEPRNQRNEPIYSEPRNQRNEPIYSEPYNQRNEPIYENIQFNSSETSSNKYYKGPINGDIYAKVDKKNIDKSELLKEIDNFILENSENYPLAYRYVGKYA